MSRRTFLHTAATAALSLVVIVVSSSAASTSVVDPASFPSLQAAIDANPGRIIQLAPGEYIIDSALRISADRTELHGPARILQSNSADAILRIENADGVRINGIAFSRSTGDQEAEEAGISVSDCDDLVLTGVEVSDNHSHSSILVRGGRDVTIADCTVTNYKGLAIDDRTKNPLYGFAFKVIDGTGIQMRDVEGVAIRNNRVREQRFRPTKETRDKYDLGTLTVMPKERGRLMDQDIFNSRYTNNWHQGAAIQVTAPETSRRVLITGNVIDNPAQGLDLHCDNAIVTGNLISHAMIGMKAMHGAKHILIDGNQFAYVDLWGVLLMPGAASHRSATEGGDVKPARENVDGGTIVSNNIFSYFGFGDQHWNWASRKSDYPERNVIALLAGQLEENPPIRNLLVTGNVVYDSGRDTILVDGKWTQVPPRYRYALYVEQKRQPAPENVRVEGNLFDAGLDGTTNFPAAR